MCCARASLRRSCRRGKGSHAARAPLPEEVKGKMRANEMVRMKMRILKNVMYFTDQISDQVVVLSAEVRPNHAILSTRDRIVISQRQGRGEADGMIRLSSIPFFFTTLK